MYKNGIDKYNSMAFCTVHIRVLYTSEILQNKDIKEMGRAFGPDGYIFQYTTRNHNGQSTIINDKEKIGHVLNMHMVHTFYTMFQHQKHQRKVYFFDTSVLHDVLEGKNNKIETMTRYVSPKMVSPYPVYPLPSALIHPSKSPS